MSGNIYIGKEVSFAEDNLLLNVLVSPELDLKDKENKEIIKNRIDLLSEAEQNLLSNGLKKLLKIKDQFNINPHVDFPENGVGFFLLINKEASKKKHGFFSFLSSSSTDIIMKKISDVRNAYLDIQFEGKFLHGEFLRNRMNVSKKAINSEITSLNKSNDFNLKLNENLRVVLNEIKDCDSSNEKAMIALAFKITKLFMSNSSSDEEKDFCKVLAISAATSKNDTSRLLKSIDEYTIKYKLGVNQAIKKYEAVDLKTKVVFWRSGVLINLKIKENEKKCIKSTSQIFALNGILKLQESYALKINSDIKSNEIEKISKEIQDIESNLPSFIEILKAIEIIELNVLNSLDASEFFENLELSIDMVNLGIEEKDALEDKDFNNFTTAINRLRQIRNNNGFVSTFSMSFQYDLHEKSKPLNDSYLKLNGLINDLRNSISKSDEKELLIDIDNMQIQSTDRSESDILKINCAKEFIAYLKCLYEFNVEVLGDDIEKKKNEKKEKSTNEVVKLDNNNNRQPNVKEDEKPIQPPVNANVPVEKVNEPLTIKESHSVSLQEQPKQQLFTPKFLVGKGEEVEIRGKKMFVPHTGPNGTLFDQRKSLVDPLVKMCESYISGIIDRTCHAMENHPLINTIYQNFYFWMKEKGMIVKGHDNWAGIVFMKKDNWNELVKKIDDNTFNVYRRDAILLTIDGITKDK